MYNITRYESVERTIKVHKCKKINGIRVKIDKISLPMKIFDRFVNLKVLEIISSHLTRLDQGIFINLLNLEELSLNCKLLIHLPEIPPNVADLKVHCSLLELGIFESNNLKSICLNYNKLISVSEHTFKNAKNLKQLHLSNNKLDIVDFNDLGAEIIDLSDNNITKFSLMNTLNLKWLDLSNNKLYLINSQMLNVKTLTHINLSGNYIRYIESHLFENAIFLDVSNNMLSSLNFISDQIKYLYAQNNRINDISNLYNKSDLIELDLSNNNITGLYQHEFSTLYDLQKLLLDNNIIMYIQNDTFIYCVELHNFSILENPIKYTLPLRTIYKESENVHSSSIQGCLFESIKSLIKDDIGEELETLCCKYFNQLTINIIQECYMFDDTVYSKIEDVTLRKALCLILNRFNSRGGDVNILAKEIKRAKNKCFIGKLSAIVFSRCGIDSDINMELSIDEYICSIASQIQIDNTITSKRLEFIKRMDERGISSNYTSKYLKYFIDL